MSRPQPGPFDVPSQEGAPNQRRPFPGRPRTEPSNYGASKRGSSPSTHQLSRAKPSEQSKAACISKHSFDNTSRRQVSTLSEEDRSYNTSSPKVPSMALTTTQRPRSLAFDAHLVASVHACIASSSKNLRASTLPSLRVDPMELAQNCSSSTAPAGAKTPPPTTNRVSTKVSSTRVCP